MLFGLLLMLCLIDAKIIKNIDIPSCRNCLHYKPSCHNDYSSTLNKCSYFGKKNILTDEISYDYADFCRNDENKCGLNGKYFEEENNVELKIFTHNFKNKIPITLAIMAGFSPVLLHGIIK